MSAYGSSVINKSGRKLAPKVPAQRRRPDAASPPPPRAPSEPSAIQHVEAQALRTSRAAPDDTVRNPSVPAAERDGDELSSISQSAKGQAIANGTHPVTRPQGSDASGELRLSDKTASRDRNKSMGVVAHTPGLLERSQEGVETTSSQDAAQSAPNPTEDALHAREMHKTPEAIARSEHGTSASRPRTQPGSAGLPVSNATTTGNLKRRVPAEESSSNAKRRKSNPKNKDPAEKRSDNTTKQTAENRSTAKALPLPHSEENPEASIRRRTRGSGKEIAPQSPSTPQGEPQGTAKQVKPRSARKTRKGVSAQTASPQGQTDGVAGAPRRTAPKRGSQAKKSKRNARQPDDFNADPEQAGAEPGHSGTETGTASTRRRRRRAPTPDGAENVEISTSEIRMADLVKDPRTGKKSNMGERLQSVDWAEIVRKRKAVMMNREPEGTGEAVGDRLERAGREREAESQRGPQLRLVNGQMVVDQASLVVDRHAEAARGEEELEEVEEDDFTRLPINSNSYLFDNRKDPAERTLAAYRSEPWTEELTDLFYDALRMFGTDFYIISKMFPGKTRRHIKHKFVREERADPARINAVLVGGGVPMDLEIYRQATGRDADYYRDPKALEQELEAEKEQHNVELVRQREAAAEALSLKKAENAAAAVADSSAKENEGQAATKGKKKSAGKKKGKQDQPTGEADVEVLGTIED